MKGYVGKVLFVDLATGEFTEEKVAEMVYQNFLSGVGLGAYMCYKYIPKDADPLGPDNILGVTSGLLTGTGMPMTGRWMAVCKSPLTGGWGDANCGGTFAPAIKQSGYDAIFFKGISEKPVYLFIDNKGPQLIDANEVWGKDAVETEDFLEAKHWIRKKPSVACIGQSGENISLISGICNDRGRIAARSGVGAVMGSKRLKAIVLAGSKPMGGQDYDAMKILAKKYAKVASANLPPIVKVGMLPYTGVAMEKLPIHTAMDGGMFLGIFKKWGTGFGNTFGMLNGDDPIRNWGGSVKDFPKKRYSKIDADKVQNREEKKYHCYACYVGCGGVCNIESVKSSPHKHTHKPEYETINVFGALLLNDDLDSIFTINEMLNRAGMDTISAGGAVAYAIECFENGLLLPADVDGLNLRWGNSKDIIKLLEKMVNREEGIGDILADGVKKAVERLGEETGQYAVHAGGQEPGQHDSKMDPALSVHYSADPTPGRHTIGTLTSYDTEQLWKFASWAPNNNGVRKSTALDTSQHNSMRVVANSALKQVVDGIGGCIFAKISGPINWKIFEALNAATGWDKTSEEYLNIGLQMQTLRQQFNIKHGVEPKSFRMHARMVGEPPLKEGPLKGVTVPIDKLMSMYWMNMGWDEKTGAPLEETLIKYGILDIDNEIKGA